tara:strand:- start:7025 stop:8026 length:1002 start_codon:yes stop_codon:yes gene_type:complete
MNSPLKIKGKGVSRIIKSRVIQSPLAGVTDHIFRRYVRRWAPNSLLFTEMVNASSLNLGFGLRKVNNLKNEDGPVGIQLFDNNLFSIREAALESEACGAYLIDINMGCPVKKIAKKGGGSALINNPKLAVNIVKIICKAVKVPVSVKTRIGWSNNDKNIEDFLLRLQDAGANMMTIHGRSREQGFSGSANWEIIGELKEKLDIPIIANGDICDGNDAIECLKITKADGVMIGRGILGAPWIIGEIDSALNGNGKFKTPGVEEKLNLLIEHIEALVEEKGNHGLLIARKYISWTCKDFSGAKNLRNRLVRANTCKEAKELILNKIDFLKSNNYL